MLAVAAALEWKWYVLTYARVVGLRASRSPVEYQTHDEDDAPHTDGVHGVHFLDGRVIRVPQDHVIFFMANFWHCGGAGLSPEPRFHGFQLASWTQIPTGVYT
jgi:hypothetical protein